MSIAGYVQRRSRNDFVKARGLVCSQALNGKIERRAKRGREVTMGE